MENKELKMFFDNIITVLSKLDNKEDIFDFLRDLLSEKEVIEFSNRFKVAQMLENKISYKKIEEKTWISSTTIARISKFLNWQGKGYKNAISILNKYHHHQDLERVYLWWW